MHAYVDEVSLRDALDGLWRDESRQAELAKEFTERLAEEARLLLVAWDAATIVGPHSGALRLDGSEFTVCDRDGYPIRRGEVVKATGRSTEVVRVEGFELAAVVAEASGPPVVHTAAAILRAAQTLRDHGESIWLRPPSLRSVTFDGFASEWAVSTSQVEQWIRWMPALLAHVDA